VAETVRKFGMASKHHQTWASIRHRGRSIGPELGGPWWFAEVDEVAMDVADMALVGWAFSSSALNCKRQHWPSARTIVFPVQPVSLLISVQQLRVFSE
jgi:hypothetical protein